MLPIEKMIITVIYDGNKTNKDQNDNKNKQTNKTKSNGRRGLGLKKQITNLMV